MVDFWWRKRSSTSLDRRYAQFRANHPSGAGRTVDGHEGVALSAEDWEAIRNLLSSGSGTATDRPLETRAVALGIAVDHLRTSTAGQTVSGVNSVTNQLLDIWAIARELRSEAARPAEELMSALVGRELVSTEEIRAVCDEILVVASGRARPTR